MVFLVCTVFDCGCDWLLSGTEKDELSRKVRKMISITRKMEKDVAENEGHLGPSNYIETIYWMGVAIREKQNGAINLNRRDPKRRV